MLTLPRKICVVTGSRADYGLLYWVMREIQADPIFQLQVVATGMHLAPEFGHTWQIIERDGFPLAARIETQLSSDTPIGVAKAVGLGVIGFADAFQRLAPDLVMVLGDRYEILAAAQAAYFAKIPIAHLAGGDVTEGAFDEAIRHSITKMSALHFVTNSDAARRVRQLGEPPDRIHLVGSPGIDTLVRAERLDREALSASLGIPLKSRIFLVTFHSTTLDSQSPAEQADALLEGLSPFLADGDTSIVFTKSNADSGGRAIITKLEAFVAQYDDAWLFDSLGQQRYLSLMALSSVVVGNSSSGLYEAPSLKKPVVNIGNRQKGRLSASCVMDCETDAFAIQTAIEKAMTLDCMRVTNPYGNGDASIRIAQILRSLDLSTCNAQKEFYDCCP